MREHNIIKEKYMLVRPIHTKGYIQTWLAKESGELRVLKFTNILETDQKHIAKDKEILGIVAHENILQVIDIFEDTIEGTIYLVAVTEYCKDFNQVEAWYHLKLKLFLDFAKAVEFIHLNNVLHRNIKPENLFVKDSEGKLGDFGLARLMKSGCTCMTSAAGVPLYMAP